MVTRPPATIASAPPPDRASKIHEELLAILQCDDPIERRRRRGGVILEYLPVARSIAARYRGRGVDRTDLDQLAFLGLVKAVSRWMPGRSEDFLQFAVPTIAGEIKRYFRDHSWLVRPPRRIQDLRVAIADAEHLCRERGAENPTDAELATMIGVSRAAIGEARTAVSLCRPPSLDAATGPGWTMAQGWGEEDGSMVGVENRLTVERLLATLTDRERWVVQMRFGYGWSQSRIGAEVGVSQMQVSRWLRDIANKLRAVAEA